MLENNVNQKQHIPQFQAMSQAQAENVQMQPNMQAGNSDLLKENIQDSYVANRVADTTNDLKGMLYTGAIAVPTWFAITQGMDYYAKKSRGNYEDTVHHKVGQFGDDVTNYVKGSKFGKSDFAHNINEKVNGFKNLIKKYLVDKLAITRAMAYTPSKPELDMVKGQANGMWGMQLFDYPQHGEKFVEPLKFVEDLDCYGAKEADIKKYRDLINKAATQEEKARILQRAEFETILNNSRVKRTPAQIAVETYTFNSLSPKDKIAKLKDMKAFEWGYANFADMENTVKHAQDNLPKILEATNKANKNMFARIWGSKHSAWERFKGRFIGREVYASETANKLASELGNINLNENPELAQALKKTGFDKKIPTTMLGKFFAKYNNMVLEGATNRVAGGKLIAIMQAGYLADVLYKTAKADGGSEKVKTFAERFAEMLSFFIAMPLAIQLMHKIGGLQYAGMTKEQVEAYRKALSMHNDKAMAGGFKDKAAWKDSAKNLKGMLNAGVKNPITKLFKRIGRIVTVGLEQIRPYDSKAVTRNGVWEKIKDLGHHPKFGIKQMAGYPMRIVLGMFMILPFLSKLAVKGTHVLFGKPKNSVLDEDKEEEKTKQQELPPQMQQQARPVSQTNTTQTTQQISSQGLSGDTNLLNKYKNPNSVTQTTTTTTTTTTNETNATNKPKEPIRTYIPSPLGVQVAPTEDLSAADAAMRRADSAEQIALQTLKMN